jgi:hypothetical protein
MLKVFYSTATALAFLCCASAVIAQQSSGPAEGTQDVAPAGGLTTQQGVVTEPTLCPDGTEPVLKEGEVVDPAKPDALLHYTCPDGTEVTVGSGVNADDSPANTPTPAMK